MTEALTVIPKETQKDAVVDTVYHVVLAQTSEKQGRELNSTNCIVFNHGHIKDIEEKFHILGIPLNKNYICDISKSAEYGNEATTQTYGVFPYEDIVLLGQNPKIRAIFTSAIVQEIRSDITACKGWEAYIYRNISRNRSVPKETYTALEKDRALLDMQYTATKNLFAFAEQQGTPWMFDNEHSEEWKTIEAMMIPQENIIQETPLAA